ncbi:MAG: glycosyltransferase family 9 protein [Phenylobacterium sp.]
MSDPAAPASLRRALLAHLNRDMGAAEAGYRQALENPSLAGVARHHLTRLLEAQGRWEEALAQRQAAAAADPSDLDARMSLGRALLALGRYAEGWPLLEARLEQPGMARFKPRVSYPEWDGGPVKSLTVWDEQGSGDTIQFARCLLTLQERGIEVTFVCRKALAPLMRELPIRVIEAERRMEDPAAEAWVMLASLPGRLGEEFGSLPGHSNYLRPPAERREAWAKRIGPGLHIGVVTHGNRAHVNDAERSLPAEAAAFLLTLPAAVTLSPELSPLPLRDFADTAAVLEHMALVITVDTAVAHLAGAVGRPTWVLLPHLGVDWRWGYQGAESRWYPSARLFRQPGPGDWASVLQEVAAALPQFFAESRS